MTDIIERLNAVCEHNRKDYEAIARITGKTIAQIEADTTAPDLPQEENNDD